MGTDRDSQWFASLMRYWLVSLHPFLDGNGRTSTLVADWALLKSGYPPLCFLEIIEGAIAYVPKGREGATPSYAFFRAAEGLRRSFAILTGSTGI